MSDNKLFISYHESRPGMPGYAWGAESLGEASSNLMEDANEQFNSLKRTVAELKSGDIETIEYTVRITVWKD